MGTIEIVRAKTAVMNLEMNPPEMRKERIEQAKQSLMQKIMKDHPADRYDEVVFWVVPPPIDQAYELAQQYRRETDEWYLRGERVSGRDVLDYVQENYVIVEGEAKVWRDVLTIGEPREENEELQFTRQFIHEQGLGFALLSAWNRRANMKGENNDD